MGFPVRPHVHCMHLDRPELRDLPGMVRTPNNGTAHRYPAGKA
jgi:hypothetical protein